MYKIDEPVRFEVEQLPDLETKVAITGSVTQQEVGGYVCLGVVAGIFIAS